MALITPEIKMLSTRMADWLELKAWTSDEHITNIEDIWNALDFGSDAFDFDEEDELKDDFLSRVEAEIRRRVTWLSDSYPFSIISNGSELKLSNTLSVGQLSYLLCLRLSLADTDLLSDAPPIDREERNLFQLCSTLCAAGYFRGSAISFGWPRTDGSSIITKLQEIHPGKWPEGFPQRSEVASGYEKDEEIDVIAFTNHNDGLPGLTCFYGQVASGNNWVGKPLSTDQIGYFRNKWFSKSPTSPFLRGIFMPFCPFEKDLEVGFARYRQMLEIETEKYGIMYTRYRIPFYVNEAIRLAELDRHHADIDHLDELERLTRWQERIIPELMQNAV